ncbi:chromosome replication initiation protein [Ornithinibacillus sp. L9]|uniref:Chromosome replication initiation protein n=1 Tax=Ornithinibacillus caprae TaxID=2678566 RepID=A0A6N8FBH4_9BACI|nr:DnaD domain protein [Ornithinibacillus caprae]MUK86890.1 chromosome replication initiation protein [Ornithinibacillus caprae]
MNFIGKILPVDGYHVHYKGNALPVDYMQSLTHLYQPLIGGKAVMLYQTLLHEMDFQYDSPQQTHHTLMNYLNLPLDEIYEARLKLEGIGLLKTFETNSPDKTTFTYVLQSPFAPHDFFQDGMLSQLLLHHIGQNKYIMLQNHYVRKSDQVEEDGREVTVTFREVFNTFSPMDGTKGPAPSQQVHRGPNIEELDFSWIEQMLKQRMIPAKQVLTNDNRRIINQMMVLYDLASHEIEKAILWALSDENRLNIEEFKEACHDLFSEKPSQSKVRLVEKNEHIVDNRSEDKMKPLSKEEQLIKELETISPKQLLEDLSSGNQASTQDLKVIREVMTSQGLPSPVMNVLIHYVLLQSNMKLSKAYLEKIASHWSRANLKTAKEAMVFAKRERYRTSTAKTQTYNNNYKKQQSKEVIPDWFKERKSKKPQGSVSNKQATVDLEKEKEEIAALLNRYSSTSSKNNHFQG